MTLGRRETFPNNSFFEAFLIDDLVYTDKHDEEPG
jgi:hypothetical protein